MLRGVVSHLLQLLDPERWICRLPVPGPELSLSSRADCPATSRRRSVFARPARLKMLRMPAAFPLFSVQFYVAGPSGPRARIPQAPETVTLTGVNGEGTMQASTVGFRLHRSGRRCRSPDS